MEVLTVLALIIVVMATASTIACTGRRGPVGLDPATPSTSPGEGAAGEQILLRLRVEGASDAGREGTARLRVVLRRLAAQFELRASDVLGRALWTLRVGQGRASFLDLRERRACALAFDRGARALGWPDLPWDVLPAILLGEPPVPASGADSAGRDWLLDFGDDGQLVGWQVALAGAELARFERRGGTGTPGTPDDGVSFHLESERPKVALSWSVTAREPLAARDVAADASADWVPKGFRTGGCDDLRVP